MQSVAPTLPQDYRGSSHVSLSMRTGIPHGLHVRPAAPNTDSRSILKRHPISFVLAYFRSLEPSPVSQGTFDPRYRTATHGSIHFAAVATQSSGTATTSDAPVSLSTGHVSVFMNEGTKEKAVSETA
jgi:hypothetical protein